MYSLCVVCRKLTKMIRSSCCLHTQRHTDFIVAGHIAYRSNSTDIFSSNIIQLIRNTEFVTQKWYPFWKLACMLARHLFTFEHSHVSTSWLLRFNRVKNGNRVNGVLASGQIICGWDRHVKWKHAVNHFAYCHIIRIPDSNISLFVSIKCLNWMHWIWWLCVHNERMGGDIMRKRGERGDNKEQMRQRANKKRKLAKFCFYKTTIQTKGVEKFFRFHYNLNTQRQHTDSHTQNWRRDIPTLFLPTNQEWHYIATS